ncbi:aryl-sulfate sulfohydrolase : Arylsulfatase A family protein OS=Singulisphaera acidiphila (strain ATCC BAA-1392 / DSM 18658 / VKM B-2454 / MOB10) GN=Sinac_0942 PE=4 SV=1: Sulfatase [Gemmataceae bacterium]|nr:aryl-sulfate sulfohydrolase : Arylsulfatase A family protein OS=Singulisphaera acidiphila (strain ATCC BAA-1392 / DSM 18658 / VKM B-2454 / MOB10) GN=Sinac_0942 PE=4 SV=1: Sulfatase [Gemmataceae bacterium]VTT97061.1 aryl-sulfate sulfohydrolase : Arylsulfatase A family protein OS=Singulisphaera acidiphila (strain ATCC BAA-1392 / DSM 18658 / VKM B-2454 / MOB10) GN=Sinac_0942 PE=4 SV=1: Sulfatase [Gemmataceae bacterium]
MRTLLAAVSLLALVTGPAAAADPPRKPNVVFILADDLGWTDLGCQGSKFYATPNIDKLAAGGLRFTSAYTCGPNCQPTRAAIMTGQYGPRTGVYTVGGIDRFDWKARPLRPVDNVTQLPLDRRTVADVMKSAGYATGMFGKWHLGQDAEHHPSKRGFDEAIVSMGKHFDFVTQPKVEYPKGAYLADFLTDRAVDFITRHKSEPFFLYLPHFGVHSPFQAKPELIEKFKAVPAAGGHRDPTYAAMIASVDESVGRVLKTLDDLKLADDTVVIFSSDNGGVGGYVREGIKKAGDVTDNAPLRSGKGSLYEGGVRVPWVVRWPGKVPAGTTDTPVISVDVLPTLASLAGAKLPANQPLDGASLVECFTSGGKAAPARDLFWHFPGYLGAGQGQWRTTPAGAIRSGNWKLIEFFETGTLELYDLAADVSQKTNLAEKEPERAKELHAKLVSWRKAVGAPMPTPNKK